VIEASSYLYSTISFSIAISFPFYTHTAGTFYALDLSHIDPAMEILPPSIPFISLCESFTDPISGKSLSLASQSLSQGIRML